MVMDMDGKRKRNTMGCVYVAIHSRMPDLVKIGWTNDLRSRLSVLNTSVPENFEIKAAFETADSGVEDIVKKRLERFQYGAKKTKEFYRCSPRDVRVIIDDLAVRGSVCGRFLTDVEIANAVRTTR